MRVQVCWFGYELDFSFGPTTVDDEPEFEPYQDAGSTTSYPVGFTRAEVLWEDSGSYHQFDPGEDAEDGFR